MNTPPTNREAEIFQTALALPAAERPAYLDAVCGDDHALREHLGRLLASHEESGFMAGLAEPLRREIEEEFARLKPEEAGEQIGNYKLLEQIGEGGFGTVWVADQEQPVRRRVALKIIKLGMDTREVIARFEQERQALAVMDHPNIAKVFDAGATQFGRPYFVMELVHGSRITDYCDEAKLPTAERLRIFIAVCQAVQHAHQKGIIHRDIKPSNILVTLHDGVPVPKVIDFGIAKATQTRLTDKTIYTQFEQMIGTPLYMSPEQAEMNGQDVDTRSDIYSLGVLLYELLTGQTPFTREDMVKAGYKEMRRLICEVEPKKPSTALQTMEPKTATAAASRRQSEPSKLVRLVNGDLDWIVMKTLEKDRARRYETPDALAVDIRRHLSSEPVAARPPSVSYRLRKAFRRNRALCIGAGAVVVASLIGAAVALQQRIEARTASGRLASQLREASVSDFATAQARLANGKWQEAVVYLGRAVRYDPENRHAWDALWLAVRYGQRDAGRLPLRSFDHGINSYIKSASFSRDGSRIATVDLMNSARVWDAKSGHLLLGAPMKHYSKLNSAMFNPDGSRIVTTASDLKTAQVWDTNTGLLRIDPMMEHEGRVLSASFSPDGFRILTASSDGKVRLWDAKTLQLIGAPMENDTEWRSVDFSPDGKRFVTVIKMSARISDAISGQSVGALLEHKDSVQSAMFSPDSSRIVTASRDNTARVWNASTGLPIGSSMEHDADLRNASFSPDGASILTVSLDGLNGAVRVWDATTCRAIGVPMTHKRRVLSASFSPDGTRIATASGDRSARVWDAKTGLPVVATMEHEGQVFGASFSPDGTRIATASYGFTARVWDAKTGLPIGAPLSEGSASFSPDGSQIITTTDNNSYSPFKFGVVWDPNPCQPVGTPMQHKDEVQSAGFSPDGTRIVTASSDGIARFWDPNTCQPVGIPMKHKGRVQSASFSPDGTYIVTTSSDGVEDIARFWDTMTCRPIGTPMEHKGILMASFSPGGNYIVTTSDRELACFWDTKTCQRIKGPLKVEAKAVRFSRDGSRIVAESVNGSLEVFDAKTGTVRVRYGRYPYVNGVRRVFDKNDGHSHYILSLAENGVASSSPDGLSDVSTGADGTLRFWDARTRQTVCSAIRHRGGLRSANFSPNGLQIVTAGGDNTARLWDVKTEQRIAPDMAEKLAIFCAGARLDPQLGSLRLVKPEERLQLWRELQPALAGVPDWRFAAEQNFPRDPTTTLVSPRTTVTVRQAATALIATMNPATSHDALNMDPLHPLGSFASARIEAEKTHDQPANPARAAWLCEYGMKHLPAETSDADLRIAAELVSKVAETVPEAAKHAQVLLDRAAKLESAKPPEAPR